MSNLAYNEMPPPLPQAEEQPLKMAWIEQFFGVLFHPKKTFDALATPGTNLDELPGAALLLILVFAMDGTRSVAPSFAAGALFSVTTSVFTGIIYWLSLACLLAVLASVFGVPGSRVRSIFASTAWAFAPWIFIAPIFCYRFVLGPFAGLLTSAVWLWIFVLQMLAVTSVFKLKAWQTAVLFFVAPALFTVFQLIQLVEAIYSCIVPLT